MNTLSKEFRQRQAHSLLGHFYTISIHTNGGYRIDGLRAIKNIRVESTNDVTQLIFGDPVSFVVPADTLLYMIEIRKWGQSPNSPTIQIMVDEITTTNDIFYIDFVSIVFNEMGVVL